MATLGNITFLDLDLCEETVTIESNEVEVDIIDVEIKKEADCAYAVVGGQICYTITIENRSEVPFNDPAIGPGQLFFRDPLDENLEYVQGSFTVDGHQRTPTVTNNEISYHLDVPATSTVIVRFCVKVLSVPYSAV